MSGSIWVFSWCGGLGIIRTTVKAATLVEACEKFKAEILPSSMTAQMVLDSQVEKIERFPAPKDEEQTA